MAWNWCLAGLVCQASSCSCSMSGSLAFGSKSLVVEGMSASLLGKWCLQVGNYMHPQYLNFL